MSKFWKKQEITRDTTKEMKYVSLSTYASEEEILRIISEKKDYIKGVSYIYHDKDTSVPHTHIAIELKRSRKGGQILRWFDGAKDRANPDTIANTKGEEVISVSALHDYFTHSDIDSRQAGKHQYVESDIKCIEGLEDAWTYVTAWEKAEAQAEIKEQKADEIEQMLDDIINEVPAREMARRYGRDFMKNATSYRKFAAEVVLEETQDLAKAIRLGRFESTVIDKAVTEATDHVLECVAIRITDCYSKKVEPTLNDLLESLSLK